MAFSVGHKLAASELNNPYFHGIQVVTQTLTTATPTAITFTSEIVDTHNWHSTSSNTSRYTPQIAGYYQCIGFVSFAADTTGDRVAAFRKNGSRLDGANYGSMPALNGAVYAAGSCWAAATILCNGTTDYIELWGEHNKGSNLATAYAATLNASFMIIECKART